jgi:pimeloyl-ACP methyl ester carboxylesterase
LISQNRYNSDDYCVINHYLGEEMDRQTLVRQFCTPPPQEEIPFDRKAFAHAQVQEIVFEDRVLRAYSLGTGRDVLLVHGWGSRASHMALLARFLESKGFHVLVFDAPAHGDSKKSDRTDVSSMFEFGRAIACVAETLNDLFAVIGHSLGALAAGFVAAGTGQFSQYQISTKNLVLISAPENLSTVLKNYCKNRNEMTTLDDLTKGLEDAFNFKVDDYHLSSAVSQINDPILIAHDKLDEEIPVSDAHSLKESNVNADLKLTNGLGHNKILASRGMFQSIFDFLS